MKKLADVLKDRLNNIVVGDREELSQNAVGMIKFDMLKLLNNYFDLNNGSVFINCNLNDEGKYLIDITATANKIKKSGINLKTPRKYII